MCVSTSSTLSDCESTWLDIGDLFDDFGALTLGFIGKERIGVSMMSSVPALPFVEPHRRGAIARRKGLMAGRHTHRIPT